MEFQNLAGHLTPDDFCRAELREAGTDIARLPESMRTYQGEVSTVILGVLEGWKFQRAWRYWVVTGPGLPLSIAEPLHQKYGTLVRVDGHGGCPSPRDHFKGFACPRYHVDSQSGLNALVEALCQSLADAGFPRTQREEMDNDFKVHIIRRVGNVDQIESADVGLADQEHLGSTGD